MTVMRSFPTLLFAALAAVSTSATAQGFAAVVSPPRFEIAVRPGEVTRQVIEITNADAAPATYRLRTADWTLAADGSVAFTEDLAAGSCRPWVAIERREVTLPGGGRYRFRFEVGPPGDAPRGECRFAVLIEGEDQPMLTASGLQVPVAGRIGVIVYASIGDAAPILEVVADGTRSMNGRLLPVLQVRNSGDAHGRLTGFLSGTDANGRRLEFTPSTLPIMPGETRIVELAASVGDVEVADIAYPVRIRGQLEWGTGRPLEFDHVFDN
jgi:hypothetical protein